jgi:Uma2 family endonuclease
VGYIINLPARQSVSVWWESAKGWQELVTDLPKRQSFSPDAAFFTGRLPRQPGKFLEGAPILTVEVRSENDYGETAEKEIAKKRVDYFEAGTLVVWAVDVLREQLINSSVRTSRFSRQCIAGGGMPKQNRLCQIGAWQSSSCFHRFGNKLANVP